MPYQIDEISEKQLKFGYWFLTHKDQFKKALTILLIVWCVVTVGYGIFGFVHHFLEQKKLNLALQQLASQQLDFASYHQRHQPQSLALIEPVVIYTGKNRYDVIAIVKNPNERWLARELVYQLESGEFFTATTTTYLLPNQERHLIKLALESPKRLTELKFKVLDLKWERVKANFFVPGIDFITSEVKFHSSEDQGRNWVSFLATNNTINNFWEVNWQAVLYSGQKIVGINQSTIEEFLSSQTREVTLSWYERLPRVTRVEVFPDVDLLNPGIIYQVPGKAESLY